MSLTLDHRSLPEALRAQLPADTVPQMPKPPEGQLIFSLPEPQIDWAPGICKEEIYLGGIQGLAVTTTGAQKKQVLFHIHGGGFTGGSWVSAYRLMDGVKRQFDMNSYSVAYTLAPEAKAPVQVEQCVAFYQGILALGYEHIVLAGESAGGNLVLAVALELKRLGLPLPSAVICSSPVVDFSGLVDRGPEGTGDIANQYAGSLDLTDPRLSPIFGDYVGFPPLLLQAGQLESLKFDSLALADKLKDTDCDCTLSIWEGGMHAFGIDPGDSWINQQALAQILDFIADKCF